MEKKLAIAMACLLTSSLGGVALGSYTIGGFRSQSPANAGGDLAISASGESEATALVQPVGYAPIMPEQAHVCRGCDAHPYREWGENADQTDYVQGEEIGDEAEVPVRFVDAAQDDEAKGGTRPLPRIAPSADALAAYGVTLPEPSTIPQQAVAIVN